jgi:hypothetical protein
MKLKAFVQGVACRWPLLCVCRVIFEAVMVLTRIGHVDSLLHLLDIGKFYTLSIEIANYMKLLACVPWEGPSSPPRAAKTGHWCDFARNSVKNGITF